MNSTQLHFYLPLPLEDVLAILMFTALLGLVVYGFVDMFTAPASDGEHRRGTPEPLHPLDATGWTLLIDGNNFAYRNSVPRLEYLLEVIEILRHRFENAQIIVFCEANLRYKFSDEERREYVALFDTEDRAFIEVHGKEADEVILKRARQQRRCIAVSNDWFGKGEELQLRIGVPLLQIRRSRGRVRPADSIYIFRDPRRPQQKTIIPVAKLFHAGQ